MIEFKKLKNTQPKSNIDFMISRLCPICGSQESEIIQSFNDIQFYTDDIKIEKRVSYSDVQCKSCYSIYKNPVFTPKGFELLFSEAGQSYGQQENHAKEQIRWLKSHLQLKCGMTVLDVGCFDGRFLNQLPSDIYKIGIDINADAIATAKNLADSNSSSFLCCDFDEFQLDRIPSVITMFHVLEHLPDPAKTLEHLHRISNEETRLIVEVPVLEMGKTDDINGFFSNQHLTHFSKSSLFMCLTKAGWTAIESIEMKEYNGYRVIAKKSVGRRAKKLLSIEPSILEEYLSSAKSSEDKIDCLLELVPDGNIIVWGSGMHTEMLFHKTSFFRHDTRQFILVDSDKDKCGKTWRGIPIISPGSLPNELISETPIVISSYGAQEAISDFIKIKWKNHAQVIKLYKFQRIY
jgi:2-polyprenyl-3-methyl-5-hydroxy-6-metoxy-1,4-benzoquinol methylase